jgi:hypothetical protein
MEGSMKLITERALAFVYCGDWVAECPMPSCGNVEHLFDRVNPKVPTSPRIVPRGPFVCSYCGLQVEVEWPEPELIQGIMGVLMKRPVPHTRNWFPTDHPLAIRMGVREHGQSIKDLERENREHGVE